MAEQVKLSYDAYSKLKTTLEKLFTDNSPEEIRKFLRDFEVLKGNPEQFSDATSAKTNLVYKNVVDSVVQIAERAGINVSRSKIAKVIRGLFEEEEITKEDVVVKETETGMEEGDASQTETNVSEESSENTATEEEIPHKEDTLDTTDTGVDPFDRIAALENKVAELTAEVNTLKLALKEKQIELKDEKIKNENYKRSIPNKIFAILEAALPDIIEVAKQEIINSNSDIKMKCEAFDKIAAIMGTESSFTKLVEAVKARNTYSKLLKTKNIMESIKRKSNLLSLNENRGLNSISSYREKGFRNSFRLNRPIYTSSLKERMSLFNRAPRNINTSIKPTPRITESFDSTKKLLKERLIKSLKEYAEKKFNRSTIDITNRNIGNKIVRRDLIRNRLLERRNLLRTDAKQDFGSDRKISKVLKERLISKLRSRIEESRDKKDILSKLKEIEMKRFNSHERPLFRERLNEGKISEMDELNPKLKETLDKIDSLLN